MHDDKKLHIDCACGTHALHIEHDPLDGELARTWYFSYWLRGYGEGSSWSYRWRQIWHILKTGTPYGDEVILQRQEMKELLEYIQEQLKATEGKP